MSEQRFLSLRKLLSTMKKKTHVPKEFASLYYLRGLDLMPEPFRNYPHEMDIEQCRRLYRQGWLFHDCEDALRVREIMRRAYVDGVMRAKGGDNILFDRPLCP